MLFSGSKLSRGGLFALGLDLTSNFVLGITVSFSSGVIESLGSVSAVPPDLRLPF